MKKLIGALVGGIIVFAWQAASWMFLGVHENDYKHHPEQAQILQSLSAVIKEDGMYMLPSAPKDATAEEHQKVMKEAQGKPMASIMYLGSYSTNMVPTMIHGLVVDIVLVFLLIYLLTINGTPGRYRIIAGSIAAGLFSWLWEPYMGRVWFQLPSSWVLSHLIDAIAAWALCGLWLNWWLTRKRSATA